MRHSSLAVSLTSLRGLEVSEDLPFVCCVNPEKTHELKLKLLNFVL